VYNNNFLLEADLAWGRYKGRYKPKKASWRHWLCLHDPLPWYRNYAK